MTDAPAAGHNTGASELVSFVERFERVQEEIDGLREDAKEIIGEAKASGFDPKILRKVLARRRMDPQVRRETDELIDTYEQALGEH